MKAKLLINGQELEVEISDEELKKLEEKQKKKTGYERVDLQKMYYTVDERGNICSNFKVTTHEDDVVMAIGNCYSDKTVAENNARADKLMRQLRRSAVEYREKELNWLNEDQKKYTISFDYDNNILSTDFWCSSSEFGTIYFDSEKTAERAIEAFRDELLWYFTEYEDSL